MPFLGRKVSRPNMGDQLDIAAGILGQGDSDPEPDVALVVAHGLLSEPVPVTFQGRSAGLTAYARARREVKAKTAESSKLQATWEVTGHVALGSVSDLVASRVVHC